jgi:hypothetical protein
VAGAGLLSRHAVDYSTLISPASLRPRVTRKFRKNTGRKSLRRAAWVERRNRHSRPAGCPADEVTVKAAACTAAAATETTASGPTAAAAATTAAAASYVAVAASAATAAPTAAAPKAAAATTAKAAAAAARGTRATAKKKAAGAAGIGTEMITSSSPLALPAKRKRQRQPPGEPTSDMTAIADIPQLDGDGGVSVGQLRRIVATLHAAAQRTASHAIAANTTYLASSVAFNNAKAIAERPSERKD